MPVECCLCHARFEAPVRARVRSNVRKFRTESFEVWRCAACGSIHAADEVDLAHYYAHYPFHALGQSKVDWMLRAMYGNLLRRLVHAGVSSRASILDYGCGSGLFVRYLGERGFGAPTGYDEYTPAFADRKSLEREYDCVLTQDVIEHVADPRTLAAELHRLARPGGRIVVGTPNADSVDLARPEWSLHSLHQPYHRHVLSRGALLALGEELGWKLVRFYPTMYSNTLVPFVNAAFIAHYFRMNGDDQDLAVEPIRPSLGLFSPRTLFLALFGYFFPPRSDMMAVFERR